MQERKQITVAVVDYDRELEEYRVKAYGPDGRIPEADYYTSDREDAYATASAMIRSEPC